MKRYQDLIEQAIGNLRFPASPRNLYEPIAYTMSLGGKRLRPVLTLMACEAMGGQASDALDTALAIELFHNFTLLHDDVMDRADVRRGQPTVHCKWNDNVAILSGDAMLTIALEQALKAPQWCRNDITRLVFRTAMEVFEGQQYDIDFESRTDVSEEEYIDMIRLKTSVLLGCACQAGAIIAGATPEKQKVLYDMGMHLGLAFQLQDDYLDVWGDPATFGKEIGGDILNNKKTFLLINAQSLAVGSDAQELSKWLGTTQKSREKIEAVTAIYERLGLKQRSREAIEQHSTHAAKCLSEAGMTKEAELNFAALIGSLTTREN